ncbi:MAG: endolytic transglycosylase MltG [Microvirga sp.]
MFFGRRKQEPSMPLEGAGGPAQRLSPRSPSDALKPMLAPPPPPRIRKERGGLLSTLSGLLTFVVVVAVALIVGVVFVEKQANEPGPLAADKIVLVPKSIGTGEIATLLKREGVINQTFLFELQAFLNRQRGTLKAGEFLFRARASIDEAIDTLIVGKAILHSLTVPEGLTSEQIVQRIRDNEILTGDVTEMPREGTLLPDTYKFERGETRQQAVNRMQRAQREALNQIWARRSPDLPIKTPQELVILASIVEKETGRADERSRVAGVFINRLGRRMKLQSDPTIVYGLVGGKGTLGRGILRAEIDKATPYNTYAIEGLPPGPIANPGRAALEAVANPSRTKDLYFVADGSGGHAFAESLDQHQKNVTRWRQIEKARAADAPVVDRAEPPPGAGETATPQTRGDAPGILPGAPAQAAESFTSGGNPPNASGSARGRAFDASEGTPRDPLRNRAFDLNSPKTVPALRMQ